jgi:hypothetical protein
LIGDEDGGVEGRVFVAAGGVVHPVEDERGGRRGRRRVFQNAGAFDEVWC